MKQKSSLSLTLFGSAGGSGGSGLRGVCGRVGRRVLSREAASFGRDSHLLALLTAAQRRRLTLAASECVL